LEQCFLLVFASRVVDTGPISIPSIKAHVTALGDAAATPDGFKHLVVEEAEFILVSKLYLAASRGERHDEGVHLVMAHTSLLVDLLHQSILLFVFLN
jgi:hypothetical protein